MKAAAARLLASGLFLLAAGLQAQIECVHPYYWEPKPGRENRTNNCFGFSGFRCYKAVAGTPFYSLEDPACDPAAGACVVQLRVPVQFPGLQAMTEEDGLFGSPTPQIYWFDQATAPPCDCGQKAVCGQIGASLIARDFVETWVERTVSCQTVGSQAGAYSIRAVVCGNACRVNTVVEGLRFEPGPLAQAIGCPLPPPEDCNCGGAEAGGASCARCETCKQAGGGCSVGVGGGLSCSPAASGPGALLRYLAGGVGADELPGTPAWRPALGRHWSHSYAERIVTDPDPGCAWLLTRFGSFRQFKDLAAGSGLRLYQTVSPSDEYRRLYHDSATGGWELHSLDGRKDFFLPSGLWDKTVLPQDPAHPLQASYAGGALTGVSFPDGRSEAFTYHLDGKLATITEQGVGGAGARTWTYGWTGDDLTRIDRPDGTAWLLTYGDARFPGYLTRLELLGSDGTSSRIEAAFEYDASGNVVRSWRGDAAFTGPGAVAKQTFAYTNPSFPTQTVVTDGIGNATTYVLERDPSSVKVRVQSMTGNCPTCGLPPNTAFEYGDAAHSLLPTAMVDGRGNRTVYTYGAQGRMLTRTEAVNDPALTRTITWAYDANFPALPVLIEQPSTAGGAATRRIEMSYDPSSAVMESRTLRGVEAGSAFELTTLFSHNASGEMLTADPPGYGTADQTIYTYGLPGRNGHVAETRADPLVGTTTYGFDGFNRRTSVTDPNGVETATSYDALNRVTEVRQKGATPAEDLATTYTYTPFGDLRCTRLPRGNGIEQIYDGASRLVEVRRKPDCLPATQALERTVYTLDDAGNRVLEDHQRWDGAAWVSEARTRYEYACHLNRLLQGSGGPEESVTEHCFDAADNLEQVWDGNHPRATNPTPTQRYAYDALNRLVAITQPWTGAGSGNTVTSYSYDVQDHLAAVTDAEGNTTTYTYSDRDLLTRQVSPVSGTTTYVYNEHGELTSQTDARGVTVTHEVDALDRVTRTDYSGEALDIDYTYDDPAVPFARGRLTRVARDGGNVDYRYDRFGRMIQDGALSYTLDANGNRRQILYPGGLTATYTHDFADREATLEIDDGVNPPRPVVTAATYKPFGPLATLALGNGLQETRGFDARYHPTAIEVPGWLDWSYETDDVGNVTAIDDLQTPAASRRYAYQDFHYFLTSGDGPWGARDWSYDKIGNRLAETRNGATFPYTYRLNAGGGHLPQLERIDPSPIRRRITYSFDAAGNQERATATTSEGSTRNILYTYDAESRLSRLSTSFGPSSTTLRYDGRGFLRDALQTYAGKPDFEQTTPVYSSEGLLHARTQQQQTTRGGPGDGTPIATVIVQKTTSVLYFASRPVALEIAASDHDLLYLTTDHLGTPVLATDATGGRVWEGGFEPFGKPYNFVHNTEVFLRLPGQWDDPTFGAYVFRGGLFYNVHRWYQPETGRYSGPDPLGFQGSRHLYAYAEGTPTVLRDPLGLAVELYCHLVGAGGSGPHSIGGALGYKHCFVRVQCDCPKPYDLRLELVGNEGGQGIIPQSPPTFAHFGPIERVGYIPGDNNSQDCSMENCLLEEYHRLANQGYPYGGWLSGPNSNTFAGGLLKTCGVQEVLWPTGVPPYTEP